ncbi:hypothetical protein B0H14DRAFT_2601312 [Mycena olivaceomarginata]|nr:hypothetical protein B0H14DRAFT_2601312 [Mycena olivaceomarginata]
MGGRPTKQYVAALRECKDAVLTALKESAATWDISPARVLDEVNAAFSNGLAEIHRFIPELDPEIHELPTLLPTHISTMIMQRDNGWIKILQEFEVVHLLEDRGSIAHRQRRVMAQGNKIEKILQDLYTTDNVEGMLMLCRPYVNEDAEVAKHFATPGLVGFPSLQAQQGLPWAFI